MASLMRFERTANRLGVQNHCKSLVKSVQFRAFLCIYVKNVCEIILKSLNILRDFCVLKQLLN